MPNLSQEPPDVNARAGSGNAHQQTQLLTYEQFAQRLDISPSMVRSLVRRRKVRASTLNRSRRIPFSELQRLCLFDCARSFCAFLWEVPLGCEFSLWNLQGALRFANPGITYEQKYSEHLRIAVEERLIEPTNELDTYRRTGHEPSTYVRYQLQALEHKLIEALRKKRG